MRGSWQSTGVLSLSKTPYLLFSIDSTQEDLKVSTGTYSIAQHKHKKIKKKMGGGGGGGDLSHASLYLFIMGWGDGYLSHASLYLFISHYLQQN